MRLVDSHCHLNADRFDRDADQVLAAAQLSGVERILVPGWNVTSSERAFALADGFPWIDVAVGVHPHDASTVDEAGWGRIVRLAADRRVVAIGETGLDYDRAFSPAHDQVANLRRNLDLALELDRPVILHCRSAVGRRDSQDALLAEVRAARGIRAVIHSFSGPIDYAEAMLELGAVVSFSGLVFRPGEESSAEVARLVAKERLLVETDSPFLSPPGAPRSRNEPSWVRVTADWLAQQRGVTHQALGEALVTTYDEVFRA